MTKLLLTYQANEEGREIIINLPISKSLAARELLLCAIKGETLYGPPSDISLPEDIEALKKALTDYHEGADSICVAESGTAMRFMLAYISATTKRAVQLIGTGRQHQRPIAPLRDALVGLGADISYLGEEGYPPLYIKPSRLYAKPVVIDARHSSQFLSAMLLIAPLLEGEGYQITTLDGEIASAPYAEMTLRQMELHGYLWSNKQGTYSYHGEKGQTKLRNDDQPRDKAEVVEADWSAASYLYMLSAIENDDKLTLHLPQLKLDSLQGDSRALIHIYRQLGVITLVNPTRLSISTEVHLCSETLSTNLRTTPDIVPAVVATLIARGIPFVLEGIEHLKLKESDRLLALQQEVAKIGVSLLIEPDKLIWDGCRASINEVGTPIKLYTYRDHRIAMALAPLIARFCKSGVLVENPTCVGKSFPSYWDEIKKLGYNSEIINN